MANEHKVEVNKREITDKKRLKDLRREGKIPGVYYSATSNNSAPIFITMTEFNKAVKSGARIFNISVGGNKQNVLFKSIQYHPVTDQVLHIDLYGINMTKPIVNIITIININPMIILKKTESVLTSSSVISAITNIDFKDKDMVSTMVIKPLKKGIVFNWFTTLNPHFIDTVSISFSVL